jgi:hypothetical protein
VKGKEKGKIRDETRRGERTGASMRGRVTKTFMQIKSRQGHTAIKLSALYHRFHTYLWINPHHAASGYGGRGGILKIECLAYEGTV